MLNSKKIERFVHYLNKTLPKSVCNLTDDLDTKIRKILQNQFNSVNFIKKDEFDIQTQILIKIQKELKQLESRLTTLESIFKQKPKKNKHHYET